MSSWCPSDQSQLPRSHNARLCSVCLSPPNTDTLAQVGHLSSNPLPTTCLSKTTCQFSSTRAKAGKGKSKC